MRLCILYHPSSDHASLVEGFARDINQRYQKTVDLISLESREGDSLAKVYDVISYPAVLVIREDDHQLNMEWEGPNLPQIDEVMGYLV